jgi:hypothetical protein
MDAMAMVKTIELEIVQKINVLRYENAARDYRDS